MNVAPDVAQPSEVRPTGSSGARNERRAKPRPAHELGHFLGAPRSGIALALEVSIPGKHADREQNQAD